MNEIPIEPIKGQRIASVKRSSRRLRFTIKRMMQITVALAFLFALLAIGVRNAQRRSLMGGQGGRCVSNLHNVALGILGYQALNGVFPTGTWPNKDVDPESRLSWYALILPQIDRQDIYDDLRKGQPWNAGQNAVYAHQAQRLLSCGRRAFVPPGSPEPTSYVGIAGIGTDAPTLPKSDVRSGVFGYDRQTTLADITDGTANTMLIAETYRITGSWLQGGPATVRGLDPAGKPYFGVRGQFGSSHGQGVWVAMADGSVRWIDASIDPKVFEALSTIAGRERLPSDW